MRTNVTGSLTIAAFAGLWELTVKAGLLEYEYLPAPSAILQAAGTLIGSGALVSNLLHTLMITLVGWLVAGLLGIILGLLLGLSRTAYRYSMTSFEVTRSVPPITFVPAALLVFGFSLRMELVIVVYAGVWPLLMNTVGGVQQVPHELLDVARMLHMSRWAAIRKIILPAASPSIVVGLRLALSLCLVLAVVTEMVGNPAGLGNALVRAQQALQPEQMFAYVLTTGLLGITLNAALRAATSRTVPSRLGRVEGNVPT